MAQLLDRRSSGVPVIGVDTVALDYCLLYVAIPNSCEPRYAASKSLHVHPFPDNDLRQLVAFETMPLSKYEHLRREVAKSLVGRCNGYELQETATSQHFCRLTS